MYRFSVSVVRLPADELWCHFLTPTVLAMAGKSLVSLLSLSLKLDSSPNRFVVCSLQWSFKTVLSIRVYQSSSSFARLDVTVHPGFTSITENRLMVAVFWTPYKTRFCVIFCMSAMLLISFASLSFSELSIHAPMYLKFSSPYAEWHHWFW